MNKRWSKVWMEWWSNMYSTPARARCMMYTNGTLITRATQPSKRSQVRTYIIKQAIKHLKRIQRIAFLHSMIPRLSLIRQHFADKCLPQSAVPVCQIPIHDRTRRRLLLHNVVSSTTATRSIPCPSSSERELM